MSYTKILEVLPDDIVKQIQEYVDGKVIYIPKKEECRKKWGDGTNTKSELELRNAAIYEDYKAGMSVKQLAEKYFLVEKSIQRIINKQKSKK